MEINIFFLILAVIGFIYFWYVVEFSFSDQVREWWEPLLMPLVMPFLWLRNGGFIEVRNWCVLIMILSVSAFLLWAIVKFFTFIAT